jgi:hypothetical protein
MAALQKIPEGIFYISSQGHFRYGNSVNDEEWIIPTSKIKLSESSLIFGKAITSDGFYTDITNKSKDTCFGITLEDKESRKTLVAKASPSSAECNDQDGYSTHIIQKGLLRFVTSDFNNCFDKTKTYKIGQKIYLNSDGLFTNDYDSLVKSSYRIIELGEITNKGSNFYDLSVNIKNKEKIETDSVKFVGTTVSTYDSATSPSAGNENICIFAWENGTGNLIPADIENNRNIAGLYIGDPDSAIGSHQIDLIRSGKIYLDAQPSMKSYDLNGSFKNWNNSTQPIGTQYFLEKDGSISTAPYLNNSVNGYSCPIMTYIGQTPEGKYTFFVDIERPEVRKLEDLHLIQAYNVSITQTATSSQDTATITSDIDITEMANYGSFSSIDELKDSLDIRLYVKSSNSLYSNYIFYNNWVEIKQGFFHFDTIRSYGYIWKLIESGTGVNLKYKLRMDIADGFGLSIESGKNSGPIICNDKFDCKVVVKRFNESDLNLDLALRDVVDYTTEGSSITRKIVNTNGKAIIANYDLNNHLISLTTESNGPASLSANIQTPSQAKLKRVYDERKLNNSEFSSNNIFASGLAENKTGSNKPSNIKDFSELGQAMRAIYETPMALWNYKTDPNTDKEKIGVIVDRLNYRTGNSTIGNRPLQNFDTDKTFSYSDTEKARIKNFIKLFTDTNEKGVDNTNAVGIVLKALQETQQRLLNLESATYGLTSSILSEANDDSSTLDNETQNINSKSLDFGLNRMVRALAFEVFGTANPNLTDEELEADNSYLTYFDALEKTLLGTKPTLNEAGTGYEPTGKAEVGVKEGAGQRTKRLDDFSSQYFSYDEEKIGSNFSGHISDGWSDASLSTNNRKYLFNGVEDATERLINRANILTKMAFYDDATPTANKEPLYSGALLKFEHSKMVY